MARTLVIELPDDLEYQLTSEAQRLNVSLESLILQLLAQSINQTATDEADPILPLIGILRLETKALLGLLCKMYRLLQFSLWTSI